MKLSCKIFLITFFFTNIYTITYTQSIQPETKSEYNARMAWWKEARFGLFIHWGLYSVPAGEWKGKTEYGEWIRTSAQIPLEEYDKFVGQFNPVKFNADEWVRLAKDAGMKYITITTKHHDGFCLFDSKYTDFDIMSTPFKRDIMKELSDACRKEGIKVCWYHSIMDWHHPDYLPRRDWEKIRSTEGADYDRYVRYVKNQLQELTTNYGNIGVLWFDGEWEGTWTRERGRDLYNYVRELQPNIIINNRVGAGRSGMEGFSEGEESAGDFGTPEQQIPPTGLPDVNWETCMTMNDHWGYNSHDENWKSVKDLVQKIADIASKGGNFLLNVGPTSEGLFPQASTDRLKEIGRWMKINGEAIYGTEASPFKNLTGARCTQKSIDRGTRLYMHILDYPVDGKFIVHGIFNKPMQAFLLSDPQRKLLTVNRAEDALVITVPTIPPDTINTVVVLDVEGRTDVNDPPNIDTEFTIFVDQHEVAVKSNRENDETHYTTDGTIPTVYSPTVRENVKIKETTTISAQCFRDGKVVSGTSKATFVKVQPRSSETLEKPTNGINFAYFEGDWDSLPNFRNLEPLCSGTLSNYNFTPRKEVEYFGFEYNGYIKIPTDGVYIFYTSSDDGSRLYIGSELVVDNDGLHGMSEKSGVVALAKGFHPIRVTFFEKTGSDDLKVSYKGPGLNKQVIPDSVLFK
ncbi:MAG: alpha-L-fucosidase [Ignavibacteriales bacterium]|nr:alpha-L-fucosidase [Ignavibacteriales bacterium]